MLSWLTTTNDDFQSSFVVQLPRRCQRRGTCERGMKGEGGSPLLVVVTYVQCCRGFEEPVLVGMAFGDGW